MLWTYQPSTNPLVSRIINNLKIELYFVLGEKDVRKHDGFIGDDDSYEAFQNEIKITLVINKKIKIYFVPNSVKVLNTVNGHQTESLFSFVLYFWSWGLCLLPWLWWWFQTRVSYVQTHQIIHIKYLQVSCISIIAQWSC